jgi:hypothetical protein
MFICPFFLNDLCSIDLTVGNEVFSTYSCPLSPANDFIKDAQAVRLTWNIHTLQRLLRGLIMYSHFSVIEEFLKKVFASKHSTMKKICIFHSGLPECFGAKYQNMGKYSK